MPAIEIEYFKADTPIHRLHPFSKLAFELAIFTIAATFNQPIFLIALILAIIVVATVARIPARKFRYMWIVAYIVVFLVLTQGVWFTSFGDFGDVTVEFEWNTLFHLLPAWMPGGPRVPFILEGAIYGFSLGLRFVAISLAFPILVMTTHPSDLVTSLTKIKIGTWKIPYNFIFVLTTALRYVPTVSREFDNTIDAQRSRGVDFGGFNVFRQVKAAVPLFVPVLVSSMLHAQDLTLALETRAFGALPDRTYIHEVNWRRADWIVTGAMILLSVACMFAVRELGFGLLPYTPSRGF